MKGCYVLVMDLPRTRRIVVGRKGEYVFRKGIYLYVGSALNGLPHRIERHLRKQKKTHWHIDYFLKYATILYVFFKEGIRKEECEIATIFKKHFPLIAGFGCSDCSCMSHLFRGSLPEFLKVIKGVDMRKYPVIPKS